MGYFSSGVVRWVIAAILTLAAWIAWASTRTPEALWAPGHLNASHETVKRCTQCHQPFSGPTKEKCVNCHTVQQFHQSSKQRIGNFHVTVIRKEESCLLCHTEHRGEMASITLRGFENPHGDFIFQATEAHTCVDCHIYPQGHEAPPAILNNEMVRHLLKEGEGAHRRGNFAKCLNCHGGGLFDDETNGHDFDYDDTSD